MAMLRKRLGEILIDMRVLRPHQVEQALKEQQVSGQKIGEIFIQRGMCKAAQVLAALGTQHGLPTVDLTKETLPHNLQTLIEGSYAEEKGVIPFRVEQAGKSGVFHVAVVNPRDPTLLQELEFKLKGRVKPYAALEGQVRDMINQYYYAQDYGYDMSFHEGEGFRLRGGGHGPAATPRAKVLGQEAPPAVEPIDKHPAATSLSDLSNSAARLDTLEQEVAKLRGMISALLRVLAERGVVTREDFKAAVERQ